MFKWLSKLFCREQNIHLWLHVDGKLRLDNDNRSQPTQVVTERPVDSDVTPKTSTGIGRTTKDFEESISPGLFADTKETEVSFGTEVELPPKETKNKDN